ncbi:MAG: P1 family peptidase [Actinomycetota bacterium]|nr:P1 family peptidase [Actinomycetota bacterium]
MVLPPRGNVAACDIRGSSPGERELASLHLDRRLTEVHGVVLTGGSAFGLATADGVMSWLEEKGIGHPTGSGVVPIVPAAVIFDLGPSAHRPGAQSGRAACDAAIEDDIATGTVGAGAGATVGKWAGREYAATGGLGIASAHSGALRVAAIAVVNAVGDVVGGDGSILRGTSNPAPTYQRPAPADHPPANTVLALVATQGGLDKREVRFLAARGSDGITISIRPAHTRYDGDVVFAVAAPGPRLTDGDVDVLGHLATEAVAAAIREAVTGP